MVDHDYFSFLDEPQLVTLVMQPKPCLYNTCFGVMQGFKSEKINWLGCFPRSEHVH